MKNEGMSSTAFIILSSIIGIGILGTILLALITTKPVGVLVVGGLIFGVLIIGLMILLSENNYQLNKDFKLTFTKVKKYTLPDNDEQFEGDYIKEDENK